MMDQGAQGKESQAQARWIHVAQKMDPQLAENVVTYIIQGINRKRLRWSMADRMMLSDIYKFTQETIAAYRAWRAIKIAEGPQDGYQNMVNQGSETD